MKNFVALGLLFVLISCEKDENSIPSGKSIDFYYISEYKNIDNSFKIIDSSVVISDSKIIDYSDIISYSSKNYTFVVSDSISDRLNDFKNHSIHGVPFALVINKEIIYTGYFWASYSSSSCDWITIDPLDFLGNNELTVQLGYPGMMQGDNIPDKIISLLYSIVNTQSQPRIDKIAAFFKSIHRNQNSLNSFRNFVDHVNNDKTPNYDSLFKGLRTEAGWGNKTAALFF